MTTRWRSGVLDWTACGLMLAVGGVSVYGDVTDPPAWWMIAVHAVVVPTWLSFAFGSLMWRITADPEGLRIRSAGRTRALAWEDVAEARPGPGTSLRIRLRGRCDAKAVVIRSTGMRRPRRVAAEITAMARSPELRPV